MLVDADHAAALVEVEYDVAVLGAGTVGLIIARFLRRSGLSVVLLEAGDEVASQPEGVFAAKATGRAHTGCVAGRAIGVGGTSALWGGQLAEFAREDLQRSGREWPLMFEELDPLYDAVCAEIGVPRRCDDATARAAFSAGEQLPDSVETFYTQWLPQPNMAALLKNELRDDRLPILTGAAAYSMLFDEDRAVSIGARTRSGKTVNVAARAFVLGAGTIGNVQFALSAQYHGAVPWAGNKAIGRYFQDHLGGKVASVAALDERRFRSFFENGFVGGIKLQPKLRRRERGVDAQTPGVCGFFAFRSSFGEKLEHLKRLARGFGDGLSTVQLKDLPASAIRLGRVLAPAVVRYAKERRIMAFYDQGLDFVIQAEQWPIPESRIVATGEPGPLGLVPVAVDWRLDGREGSAIAAFAEKVKSSLLESRIAALTLDSDLQDGTVLDRLRDTYHQAGGLCMDTRSARGVTNSDATIRGTTNVYVAGAAVMPTSSYANTTYTALALSVRLARQVVQRSVLRP